MLQRVGRSAFADLRHVPDRSDGFQIDLNRAERSDKRAGTRQCKPAHRHAMHRTEKHYAAYGIAARTQSRVCPCRNGAGIDVTRVRDDERLGPRPARNRPACSGVQQVAYALAERGGRARVEHSGHCGRSNGRHRKPLRLWSCHMGLAAPKTMGLSRRGDYLAMGTWTLRSAMW